MGQTKEIRRTPGFVGACGAFLLGATVGSVAALLYAPASGKVTRKRIGMKIRSLQTTAGRQLGQAQKLLAKRAELLRETASEKIHDAQTWVAQRMNGNGKSASRRAVHHV